MTRTVLIEIPTSTHRFTRDTGEAYPCIICGKAVTSKHPKYLRVVEGGSYAVLPEFQGDYDGDPGDLGFYPIGSECLRNHPELRPYAT